MRLTLLPLVLALGAGSAAAADDIAARLAERLRASIPDAKVTSVKPSGVPGLFEVAMGPRILYMTEDGRYVMTGDLMDLKERRNLSEERRRDARVASLKAVGGVQTIDFAPPEPKHWIYVFTDVDCGYCRKMHQEVAELNSAGIGVHYLAYPRQGLESEGYHKIVSVWCAADRKKAMTLAKSGKEVPAARCDSPVEELYELGEAMGVRGTPAVFLENGEEVGGYVPAATLAKLLNGPKS